ncbi:hypothetical protein LCGC14_3045820 [marine sediment metagenome]|uniref:Uncharacterized protein n=1 Tax=marine sediment metagenome TaxID=412755 RepID=A0A0F8WN52_9ZZZZ
MSLTYIVIIVILWAFMWVLSQILGRLFPPIPPSLEWKIQFLGFLLSGLFGLYGLSVPAIIDGTPLLFRLIALISSLNFLYLSLVVWKYREEFTRNPAECIIPGSNPNSQQEEIEGS